MYLRIVLLATTLLMSSATSADEINIRLGSDSARFMYLTETFSSLELELGLLYNENNDFLINTGLLVRGESVSMPLVVSVGARAYYADRGPYTVGAIAIGGDLLLSPESWSGLGVGAYYYVAPDVVSFADADGLTEYSVYASFQITPQARVMAGYQKINVSIENVADITFDKGAYFALNLSF